MPQSRDRRVTPLGPAAAFARNRASFIYNDPPPLRTSPRTLAPARARAFLGSENTPPSRSLLPAWYPRFPLQDITAVALYPRTPLRDITAVARAIVRRRARLGEVEGQRIESTVSTTDQSVLEPSEPASASAASSSKSPKSVGVKLRTPLGCKVPKIYLDISDLLEGESESLTPQKKLLNNIDEVQEAVLEELKKLKRTPSAKKAEREKRVRTLMSMR